MGVRTEQLAAWQAAAPGARLAFVGEQFKVWVAADLGAVGGLDPIKTAAATSERETCRGEHELISPQQQYNSTGGSAPAGRPISSYALYNDQPKEKKRKSPHAFGKGISV